MPNTFVHPLAVLPLMRIFPRHLNFAGLVIGSIAPDLGYYLSRYATSHLAHTFRGVFEVCLPSGLAVWGLLQVVKRPICYSLPQPHRGAIWPFVVCPFIWRWTVMLGLVMSIVLGAAIHNFWDSFTHAAGWFVVRSGLLRKDLFQVAGQSFQVFYLLQQISTFGGASVLAPAYFVWLKRQSRGVTDPGARARENQRWAVLVTLGVTAMLVAVPMAAACANSATGFTAVRVFVFQAGVRATAVFSLLATLAALIIYYFRRDMTDTPSA